MNIKWKGEKDHLYSDHATFKKLQLPHSLPDSLKSSLYGPPMPRPEFLGDIDSRLISEGNNVLYVGSSNLGKSFAVNGRFAFGGNKAPLGIPGVLHTSFRQIQDEFVFKNFASSVGLDKSKDPIDMAEEFREIAEYWHANSGRPVILIIEDLHCP